jgi:hypothetical protein
MSAARRSLLVFAAAWLALAGAPARAAECAPWPGEPRPLPRVGEGDRLLMRWAELRAEELAQQAEALEASDPIEANRVWRHVLCLDPGHEPARRGAERTQPLRVHRPAIEIRGARWTRPSCWRRTRRRRLVASPASRPGARAAPGRSGAG